MLTQILQRLGLSAGLPQTRNGAEFLPPTVSGQALVAFQALAPVATADAEAGANPTGDALTLESLDYPGKTESLFITNGEAIDAIYRLSVTDLPSEYTMRQPPLGGKWEAGGGTLLEPGQTAQFDVLFAPVTGRPAPRRFHLVVSRFDPRRDSPVGEVVLEQLMRWVPAPTAADFKVRLTPEHSLTRPWRRSPLLQIAVTNTAELPADLTLTVTRAKTKERLQDAPEPVETIRQALPPRVGGTFHFMPPPSETPGSHYLALTARARTADGRELPLPAPPPVFVLPVPWLRRGRDWAALAGASFALLWLLFGIPLPKAPTVHVTPDFGARPLPTGIAARDLDVTLTPSYAPETKIAGRWSGDGWDFPLPTRWYGWRPPFGWNRRAAEPITFTLTAAAKDPDAQTILQKTYRLEAWRNLSTGSEDEGEDFAVDGGKAPVFGTWFVTKTAAPRLRNFLSAQVRITDLGGAASASGIAITGELDGAPIPKVSVAVAGAKSSVYGSAGNRLPARQRFLRVDAARGVGRAAACLAADDALGEARRQRGRNTTRFTTGCGGVYHKAAR